MVNLTGLWERFSSGTIKFLSCILFARLPMPSSRCNNVLYIISRLPFISIIFLPVTSPQRGPV
jgi:hypothetical protein